MLFQLRQAGKFRHVRGIVFGQMPGCGPAARGKAELRGVILEALRGLPVPIVFGLRFGHTTGKCLTLPLGTRARLSAGEKVRLTLLEPAVVPLRRDGKRRKQ